MKPLQELLPTITEVVGILEDYDQVVQVCGSIRRGLEDVERVHLAVRGFLEDSLDYLVDSEAFEITREDKIMRGRILNRLDLDINDVEFKLYYAEPEYWGAMVLALTGNRNFNIAMRERAKSIQYKLSPYGLYCRDELVAGRNEEQIFYALDVDYIEPEDRNITSRKEAGGLIHVATNWQESSDTEDKGEGR